MAEEIGFENGRNSNFEGLVSRDLDLDLGSGHTAYRRASLISTSTYMPNFIEIGRNKFSKVTTEVLVKFRVT